MNKKNKSEKRPRETVLATCNFIRCDIEEIKKTLNAILELLNVRQES